jgi:dolichyl-phosphate beta-glucosyltransferase
MGKEISVIIPAYNEQERIEQTIKSVSFWLKIHHFDYEIIVINDGSEDDTHKIISRLAKRNYSLRIKSYRRNKGKGYAVRTGLLDTKSDIVMILDADLSVSINEFNDNLFNFVYDKSNDNFIIKGQRIQVQKQPLFRIFVGKCFKLLVWLFTGLYYDTQCPFWIIKVKKSFFHILKTDGFAFDVEILYYAKLMNSNIILKDVKYYNDKNSKVTIRKALLMFIELFHIRKRKKVVKEII